MNRRRQDNPLEETQKPPSTVTQRLERMIYWDSETHGRDVQVDLFLPNDKSRVIKEISFRCINVEKGQPLVYLAGQDKKVADANAAQLAITSSNSFVAPPYDFLESTTTTDDEFAFYRSEADLRKLSILKRWENVEEMCQGVRLTDEQAEVPSHAGILGTLQRRSGSSDNFILTKRQVVIGTGAAKPNGDAQAAASAPTETVYICPRKNYNDAVRALGKLFPSPYIYGNTLKLHFDSVGETKGSMVVSVVIAIID